MPTLISCACPLRFAQCSAWLTHQIEDWSRSRSSRSSSRCSRSVLVPGSSFDAQRFTDRLVPFHLQRPDADHKIAFQYFDVDGSGSISFEEFKAVFSSNIGTDAIPFNFDSDWVKLYIGKKNVIGYVEFTQVSRRTLPGAAKPFQADHLVYRCVTR